MGAVMQTGNKKETRGITIGSKPKYVSSQPSKFMKDIEVELAEKRIKDAKDAAERAMIEEVSPNDKTE